MAAKKKTSGILVYNLLVKEVTRRNASLPENKQLTIKERRTWISEKLYPAYKGISKSRIRLGDLRATIDKKLKRLPRKLIENLAAIDPLTYQGIEYFAIDDFIAQVLPKNVFVKVDAGTYGSTGIFKVVDFDYQRSGIQTITNNINNNFTRRRSSDIPVYFGAIQLRPQKKNDGSPDSYYLEMTFNEANAPVENIPKQPRTPKEKKADATTKSEVEKRLKALKPPPSPIKKLRKDLLEQINDQKKLKKRAKAIGTKLIEASRKDFINRWTKKVNENLKKKKITDRQAKELTTAIKKGFRK
jgi:hypothetical protein